MSGTVMIALALGAAALLLASLGGWPVTTAVLRASRAPTRVLPQASERIPILAARTPEEAAQSAELLRGGLWIGLLERAAIAGCVLAGRPELIAVVIALKGLGRYPELKANVGASERFLVGTFASVLWAVLIGAAGRTLILWLA